ncbi:sugar transferase [Pseudonocardia oceani]|uniref:sugar transferase n=1 Tax=Pseudonocardia oceani TaxID=2792013 RepID=UPI001C4A1EAD|nr:sugar transferase [Pseudonocardia oceani]
MSIAAALRFELDLSQIDFALLWRLILVAVLGQIVIGTVTRTYGTRFQPGSLDDAVSVAGTVTLAGLVAFGVNVLIDPQLAPRSVPLIAVPIAILVAGGARLGARLYGERRSRLHRGPAHRVIILGAGDEGQRLLRSMLADPLCGYSPVALLDDDPQLLRRRISGIPVQRTGSLATAAARSRADLLVIPGRTVDGPVMPQIARAASEAGLGVRIFPPLEQLLRPLPPDMWGAAGPPGAHSSATAVAEASTRTAEALQGSVVRRGKRCLDIVLCLLALPLVLTVVAVIAAMLVLNGQDVFYRAQRVGRGGKTFTMYKFATMVPGDAGPRVTREADPRITPMGRWLRSSKLNELPQVLNVLKGEMSIVGPRPEDPRYAALYSEEQREVFSVRPGMTCLAFLRFGDEQAFIERVQPADVEAYYVSELLPDKLDIELEYLRTWSVLGDVRILARTVAGLFT